MNRIYSDFKNKVKYSLARVNAQSDYRDGSQLLHSKCKFAKTLQFTLTFDCLEKSECCYRSFIIHIECGSLEISFDPILVCYRILRNNIVKYWTSNYLMMPHDESQNLI